MIAAFAPVVLDQPLTLALLAVLAGSLGLMVLIVRRLERRPS
jgi:hypothetical protein